MEENGRKGKGSMKKRGAAAILAAILLFLPFRATALEIWEAFDPDFLFSETKTENFNTDFTLSGHPAEDLITVALAQSGKTTNQLGYTEAWCADFVNDCAKLAGIDKGVIPWSYSARGSCTYLYDYMLNRCAAEQVTSPKRGDLVFYYCTVCETFRHIGIMQSATLSVEGNYGGRVNAAVTTYNDPRGHSVKSGDVIRLFLRPSYSLPTVVHGDTDGSGVFDEADAAYLLRTLLAPERYPTDHKIDLNGDGEEDVQDALFLLRAALFPEEGAIPAKHLPVFADADAPTCTEAGEIGESHCSFCGQLLSVRRKADALGHDFVNHVCTRCHEVRPESVGLEMKLNDEKNGYTVCGIGDCTDADVVIPSVFEGLPVTAISLFAFENVPSMKTLTIPLSVTEVGAGAIFQCSSLTAIYCAAPSLPDGWSPHWAEYTSAEVFWGMDKPPSLNLGEEHF